MSNTLLTTSMIADKSLQILTEKLTFIPSINRSYDDSFARTGAKIGDTLKVRVPQHGSVRTGRIMQPDPLVDVVTPIVIAQQQGVDLSYSSAELALDIDEFSQRYLNQRIADLAIGIEAAVLSSCALAVPSLTGPSTTGALNDLFYPLMAGKLLDDQLAYGDRSILLNTSGNVQIVKSLSGLFNPQKDIAEQYREGYMGKAVGFGWGMSTVVPSWKVGPFGGAPQVNAAGQSGSSIVTKGWTASSTPLNVGDVITFAGVNAVHAQTLQDLGYLKQFVVTAAGAADGTGNLTISISPSLIPPGTPQQNVTASPAANAVIALPTGVTAAKTYGINLAYAKDFATFVSADLPLPPKKDSARRVYESISLRVINDFDTPNDNFLTRVDVLWGSAVLRPELATRIVNDPTILTP